MKPRYGKHSLEASRQSDAARGQRQQASAYRRENFDRQTARSRQHALRQRTRAVDAPHASYLQQPMGTQLPLPGGGAAQRKGRRRKKALAIACGVLAVLVCATGAFAAYLGGIDSSLADPASAGEQQAIDEALTAKSTMSFDEPFYVLLLGSDERIDNPSMGARSDTNILVRIDAPAKQVTLVSIPRDTAIKLDGYGTVKFNSAMTYQGVPGAITAASKLCGVDIAHYAEVDFDGLSSVVDSIGGVDVEVDSRIDDPKAGDVVIEPGMQHLDGAAALVFARTRHYVDGDYTRVRHQRELISAIVQKMRGMPITDLLPALKTSASAMHTDMKLADLVALARAMQGTEGDLTVYSATLPSTTGMIGRASYVFADTAGVKRMMAAVDAGDDPAQTAQAQTTQPTRTQQTAADD